MVFKNLFMRLDVFRKLPQDLTEPTSCGALVSIACACVLGLLLFTEICQFMSVEIKSDMMVDISHKDDQLNINIDIFFPKMPCDVLTLDIQDVMGTHVVDISGALFKKRISKENQLLSQISIFDNFVTFQDFYERVKKELDDGQGCQIEGYFTINRVPGNFHISTHAYNEIINTLKNEGYNFDFTYTINKLSFGKQKDLEHIQKSFKNLGVLNPLDGYQIQSQQNDQNKPFGIYSNFYLIAIPSIFKENDFMNNKYSVFQLTANYDTSTESDQNILFFNYELSPISVQFYKHSENLLQFLIYICGILGGVFTVAGIIDSILHRSFSLLFKKRIGKLS